MSSFRVLVLAALAAGCAPFSASNARGSDSGASSDAQATGPTDGGTAIDPPSAYAGLVLEAKPLLYWRLGETSGNFLDRSGHSHHGEPSNAALQRGQASLLGSDGDPSVRVIGGAIAAQPSEELFFPENSPYTLELWIRIDADPVGTPDILTIAEGSNGIGLYFEAGKIFSSRYESGQGVMHSGSPLKLKVPHHVVTTYDGDSLRLYIDGGANDLTKAPTPLAGHSYPVTIGRQKNPEGSALDGFIDEVAIYHYALQQSVITEHHEAGAKL